MTWSSLLRRRAFFISVLVVAVVGIVWAATAIAQARPKTLDQRTDEVSRQILCPVCTNGESIATSSQIQAVQMRGVVKQKLAAGESEQQVLSYFRQRYGDAILVSPPVDGFTALIWLAPLIMLVAGAVGVWSLARQWQASRPLPAPVADADPLEEAADGLTEAQRRKLVERLYRDLASDEGLSLHSGKDGA
ncbi:MAG TPA: cytochrome c-type biogenesis protein [Ktedonobacterales bacterium]|jgi:cytochrome c-type biogenesis protein CcmH|nr:cytochrome c-type biogenesis protein [Ktedonobacterales bacterium]